MRKEKAVGGSGERARRGLTDRSGAEAGKGVGGVWRGQGPAAGRASHRQDPLEPTAYALTVLLQLIPGLEGHPLVIHKFFPAVFKL